MLTRTISTHPTDLSSYWTRADIASPETFAGPEYSEILSSRRSSRQEEIGNLNLGGQSRPGGRSGRLRALKSYTSTQLHLALHSKPDFIHQHSQHNHNTHSDSPNSNPTLSPISPRRLRRHSFTPGRSLTNYEAAPAGCETPAIGSPVTSPVTATPRGRYLSRDHLQAANTPVVNTTTPLHIRSSTSRYSCILPVAQSNLPPSSPIAAVISSTPPAEPTSHRQEPTLSDPATSTPNNAGNNIICTTLTIPVNTTVTTISSPRTPRSSRASRQRNRRSMTRSRAETAGPVLNSSSNANGIPSINSDLPSIRLTPHHDPRATRPSLNFPAITRTLPNDGAVVKVGRYSERENTSETPQTSATNAPVGFKSKVVSRRHCEFWCVGGQWFIKDVKSSSGTFLNHLRLSPPGVESKPWPVNDGDVVQLGIDFRGGEEMIFRCVKIRVECNRSWQKGLNSFNTSTHKRLQNLVKKAPKDSDTASVNSSECSICLMSIAPCQPLFVAPCSHVWHYKCIRPILTGHTYPNFLCPNCRAHADLEADIEETVEDWENSMEEAMEQSREEIKAETAAAQAGSGAQVSANNVDDGSDGGHATPRADGRSLSPARTAPAPPTQTPIAKSKDPHAMTRSISADARSSSQPSNATPSAAEQEDLRVLIGMNNMALRNNNTVSSAQNTPSTSRPIHIPGSSGAHAANTSRARDQTPTRSEGATILPGGSLPVPVINGGSLGLIAEGPMTPRNDAGPFVLDGSAGRDE